MSCAASRYSLRFVIDSLPVMGLNSRRHWRAVQKDNHAWLARVRFATLGKLPEQPLRCAHVSLTRKSASEPDWDNLVGSFKPILDALRKLQVILDDKMSVIGQPVYLWQRAPRGRGSIEVEVWQAEPPQGLDCSER